MRLSRLSLFLLLFLCSCSRETITVFSEYLTRDNLASYYVGSPDPNLNDPPIGQRLFISWDLPYGYEHRRDLFLRAYIRYHNRQEVTIDIPAKSRSGTYVFTLLNDDFFDVGGILTYKIHLMDCEENVIEVWRHQIWVDLITFPQEEEGEDENESDDEESDGSDEPDESGKDSKDDSESR